MLSIVGFKQFRVKLLRAYGGCLGTERRRRTWQAAKIHGKVQATVTAVGLRMGQPWQSHICQLSLLEGRGKRGELKHLSNHRKRKRRDFLSSGERNGKSLNHIHVTDCCRCVYGVVGPYVSGGRLAVE